MKQKKMRNNKKRAAALQRQFAAKSQTLDKNLRDYHEENRNTPCIKPGTFKQSELTYARKIKDRKGNWKSV